MAKKASIVSGVVIFSVLSLYSATSKVRVNQIGYEMNGPKTAVYQSQTQISATKFDVIDSLNAVVYSGTLVKANTVPGWTGQNFWTMDFSDFKKKGKFRVKVDTARSFYFEINENVLFNKTIASLYSCFTKMRNTLTEDKTVPLQGSTTKVNLYGGYNEASGDQSKHISHLQFTNYMPTNECPELTWHILRGYEINSKFYDALNMKTTVIAEAAWGADYLYRCLSPEGYFYSTIFNEWDNTKPRKVCAYQGGRDGDEIIIVAITADYQTAFREGGGLSIAALAKAGAMKVTGGEFTADKYLEAAKKAYDHIKANNTKYCDDGKENLLDDYTACIAAIELFKATSDAKYKTDAGARVDRIISKLSTDGWFAADDAKNRPYYHAADEGFPLIALAYYLEIDKSQKDKIVSAIRKNLSWYLKISRDVNNPFNCARLYAKPYLNGQYQNARTSFFIPKNNESSYWWQGENSRLGSMAAGILCGIRALDSTSVIGTDSLSYFAMAQLDWVLGKNPYETCMIFSLGTKWNPDYIAGHGEYSSIKGGICNGITSVNDWEATEEGIEWFPFDSSDWHNWRWLEQWLPHEAWYMFAVSNLSALYNNPITPLQNQTVSPNKNLSISVNKIRGNYSIAVKGAINRNGILNMYNLQGKKVASFFISNSANSFYLPASKTAAGVHVFELRIGKNKVLQKDYYLR